MTLFGIHLTDGSVYLILWPLALVAGTKGVSVAVGTVDTRWGAGVGWKRWDVGVHAGKLS
jgi:hypothetical protein